MITICYPEYDKEVESWESQLREMVVAYRLQASPELKEPELREHDKVIAGTDAITAYLKKLRQDVDDWRAPGCGV
ncbi:hypothetical protein [Phaeodactylibacter sp.]|uniref:hypothetical protein n=1 Tax=Phaeodactylibacter sp. TaxID=1940289 RepID=UPI0025DB7D14|nr:hypothetical protein [Phaeodactylibacter sp.]MCI4646619.1 hypothetical protein [Phaeodactylibacter sp.]MCI5093220.1 hypothetical protein [Phaeodactylibacter sp.]